MKIAIIGSRDYPNLDMVEKFVKFIGEISHFGNGENIPEDITIVSGGADGVDKTVEKVAQQSGLNTHIHYFMPDLLDKYDNHTRRIVDDSDLIVAFTQYPERDMDGTWSAIRKAREQEKETIVFGPK